MQNSSNSDSSFERNPRRQQELRMRPVADIIYRSHWGSDIVIERIERLEDFILDKRFGIDVIITLSNGMIMTGQEKFLSPKYASFKSLTVEHMNDKDHTGDWFSLACQFYFCGYANTTWDSFQFWAILDWLQIITLTLTGRIQWVDNANQDGTARASFRYCRMTDLPENCILFSSFNPKKKS